MNSRRLLLALVIALEGLILGLRWLVLHSTTIGMLSTATFTVGSLGVKYMTKNDSTTQTEQITVETHQILNHPKDSSVGFIDSIQHIHDTLVKHDTLFKPKLIIKHDTLYVTNDLTDTIKALGQPFLSGDTLKLQFTNTNKHIHIFNNYVYAIRNIHDGQRTIKVRKDSVK